MIKIIIEYNSEKISNALTDFYNATGIDIDLLKTDFTYAIDSPLENNKYCKLIHTSVKGSECCKKSDKNLLNKCKETKQPQMHICHAGLIDVALPIIFESSIIGYVVFGRMRPDNNFSSVLKYLDNLGIDTNLAKDLYNDIPIYNNKKIDSISNIATLLVKYILLEDILILKMNDDFQKAISFIQNNLSSELTIKSISKQANISKTALYDKFHKNFGCTVNEYINKKRIEKAQDLLVKTDFTIEEISQKTGFNSTSYFSKLFKKCVGCPPLKYKKANKSALN